MDSIEHQALTMTSMITIPQICDIQIIQANREFWSFIKQIKQYDVETVVQCILDPFKLQDYRFASCPLFGAAQFCIRWVKEPKQKTTTKTETSSTKIQLFKWADPTFQLRTVNFQAHRKEQSEPGTVNASKLVDAVDTLHLIFPPKSLSKGHCSFQSVQAPRPACIRENRNKMPSALRQQRKQNGRQQNQKQQKKTLKQQRQQRHLQQRKKQTSSSKTEQKPEEKLPIQELRRLTVTPDPLQIMVEKVMVNTKTSSNNQKIRKKKKYPGQKTFHDFPDLDMSIQRVL